MPKWTKETFEKHNADGNSCEEEKKDLSYEDASEESRKQTDDPCGKGESGNAG